MVRLALRVKQKACLRGMEEGSGIIADDALLENRILNGGDNTIGRYDISMKSTADDLELVLCPAFRVVLLLLFLLLHFLHHVTAAVTMHLRTAFVHTQVFGNIIPVELVFSYY